MIKYGIIGVFLMMIGIVLEEQHYSHQTDLIGYMLLAFGLYWCIKAGKEKSRK